MVVSSPLRRFLDAGLVSYLSVYRRRLVGGFAALVCTTSIQLLSPWVLKHAIDDLTLGVTSTKLATYAGLLVIIAIAAGIFRFLMRRTIIGVSRNVEYDLRNDFFAHLQRLPVGYFQHHRTGDLMSRATNDLAAVRMMVGPAIMYASTTSIVFTVAVALMASISPWLTLWALMPLPVVTLLVKGFGRAIYHRSEQIQAQLAHLSAIAQEALAGVRVVRAYGREAVETERFRLANVEYVARSRRMIQLQGLFYPSMALFLGISGLVVLWLGSRLVVEGQMTLGEFVAFNAYLVMLSWPVIAFGWVANMLQRGAAAWDRMREVIETVPAIQSPAHHPQFDSPADVVGKVELRHLTFAYNGRPVLTDVSATVQPGQMLALVGPTGSGKTTLVDLLPRLFDPPAGSVLIDDVDIREIPLPVLRGAIGYVPQEPFLFSDTIAQNVAFGVGGAALAAGGDPVPDGGIDVTAAVAVARLDKDVEGLPRGLDTEVGERGITLSGGQKQRTAIARALMVDPRVLVLDDALSAVDTQTEEEILHRLREVRQQRTTIVVSHRISAVRDADLILVLDGGRVVERGTHDDLVAADGLYAGLYRKQLLERELEDS